LFKFSKHIFGTQIIYLEKPERNNIVFCVFSITRSCTSWLSFAFIDML